MTTTSYVTGGKTIGCEVYPPASANGGVIIIAYGSDGMIDNAHGKWATMMREYASDLAGKGFTAVIPDYFQATGTAAGSIDYAPGGNGALIVLTNRDRWAAALQDAIGHATTLPGVDPKRAGFLGFSLGGHLGLRVRKPLKVLVEFFSPFLDGLGPGNSGSHLPVQIHHGRIDPSTRQGDALVKFEDNAIPIVRELKKEGITADLHEYVGAGHGFVGTDTANQTASTLSKTRTIAFFESNL